MISYALNSERETEDFGFRLAGRIPEGSVLALYGQLGSGKTVLARGFIRGLGYEGHITSPTYTIVNEYPAGQMGMKVSAAHFDLYRINNEQDLQSTGFYDYLSYGWTMILEWCDRIPWAVEPSFIRLCLDRAKQEQERILRMEKELPC